ncbi:ROK family protein [Kitasatospora sp. NPDC001132]
MEPGGPDCACGNRGCVEAPASSDAVPHTFQKAGGRRDTRGFSGYLATSK